MRYESPRETSTRLPAVPPRGEIADRGTQTRHYPKGCYAVEMRGLATIVFMLDNERETP